jgi:hypothetical protein
MRRLRAMIDTVSHGLSERRVSALQKELDLLDRATHQLYTFQEDIERSRVPDAQGLGGASRP